MEIKSVESVASFIVETDDEDWPTFRRSANSCNWENLMGESWETCYSNEEKLETLFQAYLAKK